MSLEGASSEGVVIELRAASALPLPPAPLPERCAEPRSDSITPPKLTPAREPPLRPLNILNTEY